MATSKCTIEAYLDIMRAMKKEHQTYRIEVLNTSVNLDEGQGIAIVWVTLRASGMPFHELGQESVSRIKWSYKGKIGWVCTEHVGMRGGFGLLETSMDECAAA